MIYLKYVRRKDIQRLVDTSELAALAAHTSIAGKSPQSDPPASGVPASLLNKIVEFKRGPGPPSA